MFCVNCGNKVDKENMNFCPYCGNKISYDIDIAYDSSEKNLEEDENECTQSYDNPLWESLKDEIMVADILEPLIDVEWYENEIKESDTMKLLEKVLGSSSKYGEKVYFESEHDGLPDKWFDIRKKYEIRKPLLWYSYGEAGVDGFVVDAYQIAYCYVNESQKYLLKEVDNVFFHNSLMQPAMLLRLKNGIVSTPLYLYGMNNPQDFVTGFRKFLFQINGITEENTNLEKDANGADYPEEKIMDKVLKDICNANEYKSDYCEFGYPISHDNNRMAQAMGYFNIDFKINTYFIYDSSMSGKTCKEGFALCTDGFHYRYEKKTGIIPWKYFVDIKIKRFLSCINVEGLIFAAAFESKKILGLLLDLQEYLEQNALQE